MTLKPCPNPKCESHDVSHEKAITGIAWVECQDCGLQGPVHDQTASKWNALPRRGDCEASPKEHLELIRRAVEAGEQCAKIAGDDKKQAFLDRVAVRLFSTGNYYPNDAYLKARDLWDAREAQRGKEVEG